MFQPLLDLGLADRAPSAGPSGVVYTKPWVVELILNLSGYVEGPGLVDRLAIEPAAGAGAFLVGMARRLVASCLAAGRPLGDCSRSLIAYEIGEAAADSARSAVVDALVGLEVDHIEARSLAAGWVRRGDYLLDAPKLPRADFVLGNPPYVRLEEIPEGTSRLYRSMYPTMRGRADLYVAFFEAALRQLAPGGVCTYICADRWMLNRYGSDLRRLVTSGFAVEAVIEMHAAAAFDDDVSAYPAITRIRRAPQGPAVVARASSAAPFGALDATTPGLECALVPGWFAGDDPWPRGSPARLRLLRDLEARFEPLESATHGARVGIGVATGLDRVFITRDANLVEPSRLLPLAMAADTATGTLRWSGHHLVDPWGPDGLVDLDEFPRLKTYLESHAAPLRERHTARRNPRGWYKTIDRVDHALTTAPKLYVPDIKERFNPVLDSGTTYPHHNLYYIQSDRWDLEALGGILLSAVGQFFVECYGVRMRGGYLRFQAQYLRRIRLPSPDRASGRLFDELVRAFREHDRTLATRAAAEAYGIDPAELEATIGR